VLFDVEATAVDPVVSTPTKVVTAETSADTPPAPVTTMLVTAGVVFNVIANDFVPPRFKVVATAALNVTEVAAVALIVTAVALATVNVPKAAAPEMFKVALVASASVKPPDATVPEALTVIARVPAEELITVAPAAAALSFKLMVVIALPCTAFAVVDEPCNVTVVNVLPLDVPVPVSVIVIPLNLVAPVLTTETVLALFNVTSAAPAVVAAPDSITDKVCTPVPNVVLPIVTAILVAAAAAARFKLTVLKPEVVDPPGIEAAPKAPPVESTKLNVVLPLPVIESKAVHVAPVPKIPLTSVALVVSTVVVSGLVSMKNLLI